MRIPRPYPQVIVTKKGEAWADTGHPWIYAGDVAAINGGEENGAIVDVIGPKGKYLGSGFLSLSSKIRVRLFSRDATVCYDEAFWRRRVEYAWQYRRTVMPAEDRNACRIIFGEADQFPGLTVDRFNDVLVAQVLSFGMERIKDTVYPALIDVLRQDGAAIRGIYERNDEALRDKEGLPRHTGWYGADGGRTETTIQENELTLLVDFAQGQKTGYFLDQKYNRAAAARLAAGRRVLDMFTHTGSFALACARAQAAEVTAVDVSSAALDTARQNARLNGLDDRITFVCADAFDFLDHAEKKQYDYIILDPPAFTKDRGSIDHAYQGYLRLNMRAMQLVGRGGYLATCSCSHFMPHERFETMLKEAGRRTGLTLRQIARRQQSCDHPILLSVPETDYLKFYLLQII